MRMDEVQTRMRTVNIWKRTVALGAIAGFLVAASAGCTIERAQQKSADAEHDGGSKTTTTTSGATGTARDAAKEPANPAHKTSNSGGTTIASATAGSVHRVRLIPKGCVEFEPRWTDLAVGESLEWTSELTHMVTVHISAGAFDKTEFVVRPGATMNTGPARAASTYSIWTEPAACQGSPRGVRGSGPGLTVGSAAQR